MENELTPARGDDAGGARSGLAGTVAPVHGRVAIASTTQQHGAAHVFFVAIEDGGGRI